MAIDTNKELAELLRAAARQTVAEPDFWDRFKTLADPSRDPVAAVAHETATHYWGNFHSRNLLLMKVKPDRYQVQQGQEELGLIAEGLEGGWSVSELKRRLKDI